MSRTSLASLSRKQRSEVLKQEAQLRKLLSEQYGYAWRSIGQRVDEISRRSAGKGIGMTLEQMRLLDLAGQIQDQVNSFASVSAIGISDQDLKLVQDAMAHAQAQIREELRGAPDGFSFDPVLPTMQVLELGRNLGDGQPLSRLIRSAAPHTQDLVKQALVGGLVAGLNPEQVGREIARVGQLPLQRAQLIARTEIMRVYRSTTLETYRANKEVVAGWRWLSALDRRTCPMCWSMHGTLHKLDEQLESHPGCRCTMVPVTKNWHKLGFPEANKVKATNVVLGTVAFAALGYVVQREILGPRRHDLWLSGKFHFSHLVQKTRHRVWGGGRRLRNIDETLAAAKKDAITVQQHMEPVVIGRTKSGQPIYAVLGGELDRMPPVKTDPDAVFTAAGKDQLNNWTKGISRDRAENKIRIQDNLGDILFDDNEWTAHYIEDALGVYSFDVRITNGLINWEYKVGVRTLVDQRQLDEFYEMIRKARGDEFDISFGPSGFDNPGLDSVWSAKELRDHLGFLNEWDETVMRNASRESANNFIKNWANTSSGNPMAVAMQRAIRDEFGLSTAYDPIERIFRYEDPIEAHRKVNDIFEKQGSVMRKFARAQYEWTQRELAQDGIEDLILFRGVKPMDAVSEEFYGKIEQLKEKIADEHMDFLLEKWFEPHKAHTIMMPASSFSSVYNIANRFGDTVYVSIVPRSRILGTARTGFGCLEEFEFVVLGGPLEQVRTRGWNQLARSGPKVSLRVHNPTLAWPDVAAAISRRLEDTDEFARRLMLNADKSTPFGEWLWGETGLWNDRNVKRRWIDIVSGTVEAEAKDVIGKTGLDDIIDAIDDEIADNLEFAYESAFLDPSAYMYVAKLEGVKNFLHGGYWKTKGLMPEDYYEALDLVFHNQHNHTAAIVWDDMKALMGPGKKIETVNGINLMKSGSLWDDVWSTKSKELIDKYAHQTNWLASAELKESLIEDMQEFIVKNVELQSDFTTIKHHLNMEQLWSWLQKFDKKPGGDMPDSIFTLAHYSEGKALAEDLNSMAIALVNENPDMTTEFAHLAKIAGEISNPAKIFNEQGGFSPNSLKEANLLLSNIVSTMKDFPDEDLIPGFSLIKVENMMLDLKTIDQVADALDDATDVKTPEQFFKALKNAFNAFPIDMEWEDSIEVQAVKWAEENLANVGLETKALFSMKKLKDDLRWTLLDYLGQLVTDYGDYGDLGDLIAVIDAIDKKKVMLAPWLK